MMDFSSAEQVWGNVRKAIRGEIGEAKFKSWISPLNISGVDDGAVSLDAPNRFIRDRVTADYGPRLNELWCSADSRIKRVALVVRDVRCEATAIAKAAPLERLVSANGAGPRANRRLNLAVAESGGALEGLQANGSAERHTFDQFVVGKSNDLAYAAARRVAEADQPASAFNPLFLYSGVGLGKTHLMHAIAWEASRLHPHKRVCYLSAEKFLTKFVNSLRYKDTLSFKEEFRNVDVLLMDDFQFIAGKEQTQDEFFHTLNTLIDKNRQIVIAADRSPSDLEGVEERIKSRLNWGVVVDIGTTDYELRLGVLKARAEDAIAAHPGLTFGPKVLEYVAHRIVSNIRTVEGALNRLVAHATLVGREITLDVAQEMLSDLVRAYDKRLTIDEIQSRVAAHYNIKLSDMRSARRAVAVARPRQVAMFLSKELTDKSLPAIGRAFGGRDHTTVMHACKRVNELREKDSLFDEDVCVLERALQS